jgi:DNA-directed RNA polymerase subunit RPC12/RpoP
MSTAYTFRISLDCPHCRGGVPVNGFTNEVLCSNCLKPIELDQAWWDTHLDSETIDEAMTFEEGHGNSSTSLGGMNEKIDTGNRPPRCQDCKTEFPDALLASAVAKEGFACPGCKRHIRVRKATPLVLSLIPEADLIVHEDATGDNLGTDGAHAAEPVLFGCLSCGGGLPVDGSTRTPKCTHCGNANYLPDALWLRLHPAPTVHAFFVTRKVDAKPVAVTVDSLPANISEERALKLLKDQTLSNEVLNKIYDALSDEDDVLEALAKHPNTSNTLLMKLIDTDVYYQVRVAVAKRPNLSVPIIEQMATDSDSDVKKALIARPELYKLPQHILEDILRGEDLDDLGKAIKDPEFPEWKLYEISDNCTPEDASRILRAPNVSLRVLRRLGSNPDSRPKIKEHPMYQSLGWFAKLFFFAGS